MKCTYRKTLIQGGKLRRINRKLNQQVSIEVYPETNSLPTGGKIEGKMLTNANNYVMERKCQELVQDEVVTRELNLFCEADA